MNMTDWLSKIQESLSSTAFTVVEFLPRLVLTLLLIGVGAVVGRILGVLATRTFRFIGLDRLLARTAITQALERMGVTRSASELTGAAVFWVVFLLFAISASETLGWAILSTALSTLSSYLPRIGMAVLILILGLVGATMLRELIGMACTSAGIPQGPLVAQAFYVAAVLLVVITGITQLGIDTSLLNDTILLLAGGLIGGAALSFGLGAKTAVANLIAAHYLQPVLRIGQQVKVEAFQGEIVARTPIAFILETPEGRVVVPASQFTDAATIILPTEKS